MLFYDQAGARRWGRRQHCCTPCLCPATTFFTTFSASNSEMTSRSPFSAIEMNDRVEEGDGGRSEYSAHTQDSRAPISHPLPPSRSFEYGPGRDQQAPPNSMSKGTRENSPPMNEKTSYPPYSRPDSRNTHSTYGKLPGASNSDSNLVFAEGDMGTVRHSTLFKVSDAHQNILEPRR